MGRGGLNTRNAHLVQSEPIQSYVKIMYPFSQKLCIPYYSALIEIVSKYDIVLLFAIHSIPFISHLSRNDNDMEK